MDLGNTRTMIFGVALCAWFFAIPISAPASPQDDAGRGGATPLTSPDVLPDGRITFRLRAPDVKRVVVAGQGGQALPTLDMRNDGAGLWTVTTDPLPPDIYDYRFVVDGVAIADPSNPRIARRLTAGPDSLVQIPGPPSTAWDPHDVPHGSVTHHTYTSKVTGSVRDYYVYTPPSYDPRRKAPYPVLYLLHGVVSMAKRGSREARPM